MVIFIVAAVLLISAITICTIYRRKKNSKKNSVHVQVVVDKPAQAENLYEEE